MINMKCLSSWQVRNRQNPIDVQLKSLDQTRADNSQAVKDILFYAILELEVLKCTSIQVADIRHYCHCYGFLCACRRTATLLVHRDCFWDA